MRRADNVRKNRRCYIQKGIVMYATKHKSMLIEMSRRSTASMVIKRGQRDKKRMAMNSKSLVVGSKNSGDLAEVDMDTRTMIIFNAHHNLGGDCE